MLLEFGYGESWDSLPTYHPHTAPRIDQPAQWPIPAALSHMHGMGMRHASTCLPGSSRRCWCRDAGKLEKLLRTISATCTTSCVGAPLAANYLTKRRSSLECNLKYHSYFIYSCYCWFYNDLRETALGRTSCDSSGCLSWSIRFRHRHPTGRTNLDILVLASVFNLTILWKETKGKIFEIYKLWLKYTADVVVRKNIDLNAYYGYWN